MPAYGTAKPGTADSMGSKVWNDETVAAGSSSVAVGIRRSDNLPGVLSAEISFAANPGAFAIDVQVADTDQDKYYVTKVSLNTGLNATFVGRTEITNLVARYVRLKMVTLTNAVKVTAKLS